MRLIDYLPDRVFELTVHRRFETALVNDGPPTSPTTPSTDRVVRSVPR
jgi:hypothetical protein